MPLKTNLKEELKKILSKYSEYINLAYNEKTFEEFLKNTVEETGGTKFLKVKTVPLHIDKFFELNIIEYLLKNNTNLKKEDLKKLKKRKLEIINKAKMKYNYGERLGKNSISVIIYDPEKEKYGLIQEIKPPLYQEGIFKVVTAAGGSIDKNKSLKEIVLDEIEEEYGYKTDSKDLIFVGESMATPQMSEINNMFLVNIENAIKVDRNLEEGENSEVVWLTKEEALKVMDAKVGAIFNKINNYENKLLLKINKLEILKEQTNKEENIEKLEKEIKELLNDKFYSFLSSEEKEIIEYKLEKYGISLDNKLNHEFEPV